MHRFLSVFFFTFSALIAQSSAFEPSDYHSIYLCHTDAGTVFSQTYIGIGSGEVPGEAELTAYKRCVKSGGGLDCCEGHGLLTPDDDFGSCMVVGFNSRGQISIGYGEGKIEAKENAEICSGCKILASKCQ